MLGKILMAFAATILMVGLGSAAAPASPVLQIAETVAQCRDTAYDTCKNRECNARSQYCTGRAVDIEASPCYADEVDICVRN